MAMGLRYVPAVGFESLKINDEVSKSTFGIAHTRPPTNSDGTVTAFADIGIAPDQISTLAEELWRNSVEGVAASLDATIHAVDEASQWKPQARCFLVCGRVMCGSPRKLTNTPLS